MTKKLNIWALQKLQHDAWFAMRLELSKIPTEPHRPVDQDNSLEGLFLAKYKRDNLLKTAPVKDALYDNHYITLKEYEEWPDTT